MKGGSVAFHGGWCLTLDAAPRGEPVVAVIALNGVARTADGRFDDGGTFEAESPEARGAPVLGWSFGTAGPPYVGDEFDRMAAKACKRRSAR